MASAGTFAKLVELKVMRLVLRSWPQRRQRLRPCKRQKLLCGVLAARPREDRDVHDGDIR
jgi:hypothetical protein